MSGAREQLISLYCAAVGGANVESLTANAVAALPLESRPRVWVFAFGKAASGMAAAAVNVLHRSLAEICGGLIVGPEPGEPPVGTIVSLQGDHPIPGRRSFAASAELSQVLSRKRRGDLGLVLLSGGASSLIGAPLPGMSEGEFSHLCELLLGSGLDIHEMNGVRKRFSRWGAGRLALALAPARTICLAVSDVPGDDLASIGSGPCVADPTTVARVTDALRRTGLLGRISPSFRQYLADSARGVIPETPKASHPAFAHVSARVIANNALALRAAATAAQQEGYDTHVHTEPLTGDAAAAGTRLVDELLAIRTHASPGSLYCCIWGGETTVALRGPAPAGGRCQELALAASQRLAHAGERGQGIALLAAGTDGRDGPTDAAGAVIDADTWQAIANGGRDPVAALRAHESHDALAAAHALYSPGLTGTNVMDITIGLVRA